MPVLSGGLPLEGIRVVDLTHVWAGPKGTQVLADLGAEVIKLEAPRRADPVRGVTGLLGLERYPGRVRGERPQNRSGYFNLTNRNKFGVSLNLSDPKGADILRRLVRISDVVVDNFSAGVMNRLGLGYAELRKVNESIVVLSMSGFGSFGPDSTYVAWADTVEALSGVPAVTGYRGGLPMSNFQAPSDPVNGIIGAAAILAALRHKRETGQGQYIDLSQVEALVAMNGAPLMDYAMNGRIQAPDGDRARNLAPHGVYRCKGDDRWLAIAVETDAEWVALAEAIGAPGLAADPRFATVDARIGNQDALDEIIGTWTSDREADALAAQLQKAGVKSGPVLDASQVVRDPHLKERNVFQTIPHAEVGPYTYFVGSRPRLPEHDGPVRKPAPLFGEDTYTVLRDLLGMTDDELAALEREEVISRELLQAVFIP